MTTPSHAKDKGITGAPSSAKPPATQTSDGERRIVGALLAMTFVTGLINAVSYLGLGHTFTANMTGNIVLLGFAVSGAPELSIGRCSASLAAFLVGAVVGGRIGIAMAATPRRWLFTSGMVEGTLLIAAAMASIGTEFGPAISPNRVYVLIVLTALAMGIRNATVRRLAIPDMTTTVLTLTLTGLAAESGLAGGANPRTGRRLGSIALMFAGAILGSLLLRRGLALPLLLAGCGVLATAFVGAPVWPKHSAPNRAR